MTVETVEKFHECLRCAEGLCDLEASPGDRAGRLHLSGFPGIPIARDSEIPSRPPYETRCLTKHVDDLTIRGDLVRSHEGVGQYLRIGRCERLRCAGQGDGHEQRILRSRCSYREDALCVQHGRYWICESPKPILDRALASSPGHLNRADLALTRSGIPISSACYAPVPLVSLGDSDPRATQSPSQSP